MLLLRMGRQKSPSIPTNKPRKPTSIKLESNLRQRENQCQNEQMAPQNPYPDVESQHIITHYLQY